jgi:solute carrier family 39 (zinc transporter), member 9
MLFCRGIEAIIRTRSSDKQDISSTIAVPLILGFALMLLMDQVISPHAHIGTAAPYTPRVAHSDSTVDFDAELSELERQEAGGGDGGGRRAQTPTGINSGVASARKSGTSTTFGLVVHALADGIVLGISSRTDTVSTSLSMVVFLALVIHKGMKFPLSLCTHY